ncbi:MAG: hypothetical protein OXE86_02185 [Alphaproteobacteria bacterium]|nr:hypothetical protein [Alphaproteobacteria bacterium]
MKIISWNMARRHDSWRTLFGMDIDLALLQEDGKPPPDVVERIEADPVIEADSAPWETMIAGGMSRQAFVVIPFRYANSCTPRKVRLISSAGSDVRPPP